MTRLFKYTVILAVVAVSCSPPASVRVNPADLPPSPYSLPASTEPQSASYLRDAMRALELHAATTNTAVKPLLVEIRAMKQRLSVLESNAWQKDPLLLTCDQFIEKTHDWVMEKHRAEMTAETRTLVSITTRIIWRVVYWSSSNRVERRLRLC